MAGDKKQYTIREAAAKVGYCEMYVRRMVLDGKLPATKVDGKWLIDEDALVSKQNKTSSDRKERTFIVHVKSEDIERVRGALGAVGVSLEPRFVYDDKRKAYNKKRAEAKRKAATQAEVARVTKLVAEKQHTPKEAK
jgi:excisionase family DNA binding protein